MLAYWILIALALALALLSLYGDKARADYTWQKMAEEAPEGALLPATVIVPVKGADEGLAANLDSLAALDYPDYELIVVARSASDIPAGVTPDKALIVLAGEGDPGTGEKINNLLAAVGAARPESQIFAFADSDGKVSPGWLRGLAAGLAEPGAGLATGFRWHLPDPPDFWSLMRGVWNSAVAGQFGPGNSRFAWGGAMAIRRETFHRVRVPDYWKGAVSDDYRISDAVRAAGLGVSYAPSALVVSTDHTGAREFFGWIVRQMIITRVYQPKLWWLGMAAHLIYCGAMAASVVIAAQGDTLSGEYALVAQLGLGMLKGTNRAAVAKAALPAYKNWFDRHGWVLTWWVPFVTWIWLYGLLASACTNTIQWRGNRYKLSRAGRKLG